MCVNLKNVVTEESGLGEGKVKQKERMLAPLPPALCGAPVAQLWRRAGASDATQFCDSRIALCHPEEQRELR